MHPSNLETVNSLIAHFEPVSLDEMDTVKLMDRDQVMDKLKDNYRILTIVGNRIFSYRTEYFDTPEMVMFLDHHNGKLNRFKVRQREYIESRLSFLEVKFKSSTGRVIKQRIEDKKTDEHLFSGFVGRHTPYNPEKLKSAVISRFNRFTLTDLSMQDRVTVDFNVSFSDSSRNIARNGLVIIELKQEHINKYSLICHVLKKYTIRPSSISKYCTGISRLYENPKTNNFKSIIRQINKISHVERSA